MQMLNKRATEIFRELTKGLQDPGDCRIVGEAGGVFMTAHVEYTGNYLGHPIFSICHYFKQNGDMCCDPDMTFLCSVKGILPMSFEQAIPPIYQVSVRIVDGAMHSNEALQAEHCRFADQWLANIAQQQNLGF